MIFHAAVSAALLALSHVASAKMCSRGSLILVDANTSAVNVWNLDDLKPLKQDPFQIVPYTTNDPADIVFPSYSNYYVSLLNFGQEANNYSDGSIHFLDLGLIPDVHTLSVQKTNPSMVDFHVNCTRPIHYVPNDNKVAIFCDGSAEAGINSTIWVVDENKFRTDPANALAHSMDLEGSHHGVSVPIDDERVLVSLAVPERIQGDISRQFSLPNGFEVYDFAGNLVHGINDVEDPSKSCLGFHGSSHLKDSFAFACNQDHGGILILNYEQPGTYMTTTLSYPDGYEGHRTGSLTEHPKNDFIVGNFRETSSSYLVSFDPIQSSDVMSEDQLVALPADQCGFYFELSGGQMLLVWFPTGILRVYIVHPWILVAEVQVIDGVEDCGSTRLIAGHGYAFISDRSTLYSVDLRAMNDIKIETHPLGFFAYRGTIAGVPAMYSCPGPFIPDENGESQNGVETYAVLHFDDRGPTPGSAEQTAFILQLRGDLAKNLNVGINRVFVEAFERGFQSHDEGHHHGHGETHDEKPAEHGQEATDVIVKLLFVDAAAIDVNQASGEELVNSLKEMLQDENNPIRNAPASKHIEGNVLDEAPVVDQVEAQRTPDEDDNSTDEWPIGAIVGLCLGLGVAVFALTAAFVFRKREEKAVYELEQVKESKIPSGDNL